MAETSTEAGLSALDFSIESCMWVDPDCWADADWQAVCRGCVCDLGSVCSPHHDAMLADPRDDVFCRRCDLTGTQADIVVFIPRAAG